jgi:hypothetical protein
MFFDFDDGARQLPAHKAEFLSARGGRAARNRSLGFMMHSGPLRTKAPDPLTGALMTEKC